MSVKLIAHEQSCKEEDGGREYLKAFIMSLTVKIHQVLELDPVDIPNFLWMMELKYFITMDAL